MPTEPGPDWPAFYLMRLIMQEHGARWQDGLPGLTRPQYAVLRVIAARPDAEQTAVGEATATDQATLAALLHRLEKRGLVARTVDPADRRRRRVRLTPAGRRALREATEHATALNAGILARLTPAEQERLHELLTKLAAKEDG
ncbi:MarR family winged helix-turn-helix transcriptional regulator [Actinomadura verrucosospora]|uniref:MarR family transcriptional regulator n=1 Tax=Actinomadura verrucosospora TaxID=46165 RepID=A0A7D3VT71_ACTVE|nr:MarR family winged helix-turn-helix transcriptional regulator [Actinomadura verrucosospora]QKG22360.1 MarR family transcriptional regulator [Actinomadura verrucosospora]